MQYTTYLFAIGCFVALFGVVKPYISNVSRRQFALVAFTFAFFGFALEGRPSSTATSVALADPQMNGVGTASQVIEDKAGQSAASNAGQLVCRTDFEARGLAWPLTTDCARLGCTRTSRWAEVDGVKYALNGRARGQGYEPTEPIWRIDEVATAFWNEKYEEAGEDSSELPPTRINIGDMIAEAGKLCE